MKPHARISARRAAPMRAAALAVMCALTPFGALPGQQAPASSAAPPRDSLTLTALEADALRVDPRARQANLQSSITALHLRNIGAEGLPALSGNGQAQYQSSVTTVAIPVPGITIPVPPHDTYDAHVGAQQSLFDPTRAPRTAVERAELAETQAQVRTTLFPLRQEVSDAFFAALTDQARAAEAEASIDDLAARVRETAERFRDGAALPADTAALAASLLEQRQNLLQARADRAAALARLSELTGRTMSDSEPLALPGASLGGAVSRTADSLAGARARPEYAQFEATRERLSEQEAVDASETKPRLSAYGRLGYGRPGLDMLSTNFQSYWLAGVQVDWTPWTWGTSARHAQELELQRDVVETNEQAFAQSLRRSIQPSLASIARLDSTVALDDQIVALRGSVEQETLAKLREGVVTAAEYADRYADLAAARLARVQHLVALAQARVNVLTTLGVEVPIS